MLGSVSLRYGLVVAVVLLAGCGGKTTPTASGTGGGANAHLVAVGEPVPARAIEVGSTGTLELRAPDPGRASGPPLRVTLIRPIPREPRDACFGVYAGNESPEDGDVGCQVRGPDPLVSNLGEAAVPGGASPATYVLGQVPSKVMRVDLIGLGGTRALPLTSSGVFLARFSSSARGPVRLVADLADGHTFVRAFVLPLSRAQLEHPHPHRRPGAVFNDEVGESIVGQSYRRIVSRFGPPLKTLNATSGERCTYYDVVGYDNGWRFCFRHGVMDSALGNQAAPAGVH